jgi:hypothetical protein
VGPCCRAHSTCRPDREQQRGDEDLAIRLVSLGCGCFTSANETSVRSGRTEQTPRAADARGDDGARDLEFTNFIVHTRARILQREFVKKNSSKRIYTCLGIPSRPAPPTRYSSPANLNGTDELSYLERQSGASSDR